MKTLLALASLTGLSMAAMPAYNQLGYPQKATKNVIIPGNEAGKLQVYDINGKQVLEVEAPYAAEWDPSGEEVQAFDISKLTTPGTYLLYRDGDRLGTPFRISNDVYADVGKASLKWFYYQRSSTALDAKYAGKFARPAGHPDTLVKIYGDSSRTISSPRGWYDAGDYGKYIVNSGITVYTLLQLQEHFPQFAQKLKFDIPNEFPKLPDLLEEVRWNLDWMLTMQEEDGRVFHKLTTLKFSGSVMPEQDKADRYVIGKTTTAALDFAGSLAQASVVYKKFDKAYADKLLKAAEKAYAWAKQNPTSFYTQPSDVNTGSYAPGNEDGKDEFRFAAAELYNATKKKDYLEDLKANPFTNNGPWWGDMNFYAVVRAALDEKTFGDISKTAQKILLDEANALKKEADSSGYRVPIHPWNWNWGSNSAVANNGIILIYAYLLTKDASYISGAQSALDYLLGKNPMLISYVTNFGVRAARNPHHRPSEADYTDDPVPGMLVGGPHLGKQDINLSGNEHWKCENYASADKPALAYLDNRCSYATNEVAINWNAPLAYLANALTAIYSK